MRSIPRSAAVLSVLLLALSACEQPQPDRGGTPGAERSAFSHQINEDISGYYRPLTTVRSGDWTLAHLFIGQGEAFKAWEDGERVAGLAPVMLEFADAAGARTRVVPSHYTVTDSTIRLEGRSADLGEVRFDGRLDQDALATARRNLGDEGAVVTGTLTAGGQTTRGVGLRWWAGD